MKSATNTDWMQSVQKLAHVSKTIQYHQLSITGNTEIIEHVNIVKASKAQNYEKHLCVALRSASMSPFHDAECST